MKFTSLCFFKYPAFWCFVIGLLSYLVSTILPLIAFSAKPLAFVLFIIGGALIVWAVSYFHLNDTSIHPQGSPQILITDGPFRINRNPIYTGMALVVISFAVAGGDLSGIIIVTSFPLLMTKFFIKYEERSLINSFPNDAPEFLRNTRRW